MVNLKKALWRFYFHKATRAFDFPSAWSSPKPVILSHLVMSLSNSHNPQPTDTSLCGMLIWPLVDQQTREVESPVLKCFVSGSASGPILSSLPSLLGHFGPFPCMWDSRLEFCPVRHQWAIAGEEERDWWKWKLTELWTCSTGCCLVAFPLYSSLALPHTLLVLFPYFKPHYNSGLQHVPVRAPFAKGWLTTWSCISFVALSFSTFAHLHQAPRLSPTHWSFFHSQLFFVPRW